MAANSNIEWTRHTFNPWRGCQKVAPGCAHCYAEVSRPVRAAGTKWGSATAGGSRTVASEGGWSEVEKWNREAEGEAERPRVFCASLADVFEDWPGNMQAWKGDALCWDGSGGWIGADSLSDGERHPITMSDVRARLFRLIDATPNLDWLLLTKRPENIRRFWPDAEGPEGIHVKPFRSNVWLITSVSEQETAERNIPHLMTCRDLCPVLGVSAEPLLGFINPRAFYESHGVDGLPSRLDRMAGPDWWIFGGESDQPGQPPARPCDVENIRYGVRACRQVGVPCHVKQLGDHCLDYGTTDASHYPPEQCWPPAICRLIEKAEDPHRIPLPTKKGGNMEEWPRDLRVREYPCHQVVAT